MALKITAFLFCVVLSCAVPRGAMAVYMDAPAVYWQFEESTGSVTQDSSGNGNTATLHGASWTAAGRAGGGLDLSAGNYLEVADSPSLNPASAVTVMAWVKYRTINYSNSGSHIFGKGINYSLMIGGPNNWNSNLAAYIDGATGGSWVHANTALSANTWYHVAFTYDGAQVKFYVNGQPDGAVAASGSIPITAVRGIVGQDPDGVYGYQAPLDGYIDELKVYGRALGPQEISSVYYAVANSTVPPVISSVVPSTGVPGSSFVLTGSVFGPNYGGQGRVLFGSTTAPVAVWGSTAIVASVPAGLSSGTYSVSVQRVDTATSSVSNAAGFVVLSTAVFDPAAIWRFEESTGSVTQDSSGNGNTATLHGASWTAAGKVGGGLDMSTGNYLEVPDSPSLSPTSAVSVAAWVKYRTIDYSNSGARIFGKGINYSFIIGGPGNWNSNLAVYLGGPTGGNWVHGNTALSANTWYHVAFTYDGSSVTFYVNGQADGKVSASGAISSSTIRGFVGLDPEAVSGYQSPLNGDIDELRIYGRALSSAEMAALYYSVGGSTIVPSVSSVLPSAGVAGSTFSVNGAFFGTDTDGQGRVMFGGTAAAIASWTDTSITAVVPASLPAGVYNLSVVRVDASTAPVAAAGKFIILSTVTAAMPGEWHLDESSGSVAYDSSGNGNNAALHGPVWTSSGKVNGALDFSGQEYLEIPDSPSLNLTKAVTIAAWVKYRTIDYSESGLRIFSKGISYNLMIGGASNWNSNLAVYMQGINGSYMHGNTMLEPGQWYHVAFTYDGSAVRFYLNGAPDGSVSASGDMTPGTASGIVGWDPNAVAGYHSPIDGNIDELSVFGRALSAQEIYALYDRTPPVSAVTCPVTGTSVSSITAISGTAYDSVALAQVKLRLKRLSDGYYWNGTAWNPDEAWNIVSGTAAWSYSGLSNSDLAYGTTYWALSKAYDLAGNAEPALIGGSTFTYTGRIPGAPQLAGYAAGISSISWNWSAAARADGYSLTASSGGAVSGQLGAGVLTWAETGLAANTAYSRTVAAFNVLGSSGSASAAVYTLAAPPSGLAAADVFVTSAAVNWALGLNPPATRAEVYRSTDSSVFSGVFYGNAVSFLDTSLSACTTYYFKVRNVNGDGAATAFAGPLRIFTAVSVPQPPSGLSAVSMDADRISLAWTLSPSVNVAAYRLYFDSGTGSMDYSAPIAVLTSTTSSYTTGVLLSSASYTFALRAVGSCGVEETNTRVTASAAAVLSLSGVKAAIKEPFAGKKISGNRVTVIAELTSGEPFQAGSMLFQYRPAGGAWTDIVPAEPNHPNPDTDAPYFVHWDVSAFPPGNYDLRAVAYDIYGGHDAAPAAITVTIDNADYDTLESVQSDGKVKKEQVIANTIASVVVSGDQDQSWVTKVSVPSGAVSASTTTLSIVNNPSAVPSASEELSAIGQSAEIGLSNGQHLLAGGLTAEIILTYPDADGDGIVDGTAVRAERLKIYSYDTASGAWVDDLSCRVDKENRQVIGSTPHFSYFAVFAPMSAAVSAAKAYPNPWKPGSGGKFDAAGVTFDSLTPEATIKIFTPAGELVRELNVTPADSGAKLWDGRNGSGKKAASGVYIAVVRSGGKTKTIKLGVER